MERKLGLCEACGHWDAYRTDATNGDFNSKCLEVMVRYYEHEYSSIGPRAKTLSINHIKEVYKAAQGLARRMSVKPDEISTIYGQKNYFYIQRATEECTDIFFDKDGMRTTQLCTAMLYQFLLRIDKRCGINDEVRSMVCRRLEELFYLHDNEFFILLNNALNVDSPERGVFVKNVLNDLLKEKRKGEYLFNAHSLWRKVKEVLEGLDFEFRSGVAFCQWVKDMNLEYQEGVRQEIKDASFRKAVKDSGYARANEVARYIEERFENYRALPRFL